MSSDSKQRMVVLLLIAGTMIATQLTVKGLPYLIALIVYVVYLCGWVLLRLPLPDFNRFRISKSNE